MFRATPVNGPFYRGVRNTDIRARPEHLQGGYRLSSRIRIFAFFLGWFHTRVVVNPQKLLLYFWYSSNSCLASPVRPIWRYIVPSRKWVTALVGASCKACFRSGVRGEKANREGTIQSI